VKATPVVGCVFYSFTTLCDKLKDYDVEQRVSMMKGGMLNKVIGDFSNLPLEDKEYAIYIIKKQLIEAKRDAILRRTREAMANVRKGRVKKGTVKDLYADLESE